ncbi:MAG: efflux RND transporter permease subunit [Gemmatimonadetes bacterium]|nr:efflux RND transporter permease subunit [Gemmatimonadota bacterium]HPF61912.1 CusA/CzcA family heavy metal efflux RND transporter [Gemmatimonadales bacterium]
MLGRIIDLSIRHRFTVLVTVALLSVAGAVAMWRTPVDAIPDLSDVQVIVMTEWPGQAPELVEDQVTYPLSTEMLKVPRARVVRGMSQFGLSAVFVVFEDGTDLYWARSRVLEYLQAATSRLPDGARTMLGPDATGVGWVMQYILADTTGTRSLAELRSLQDFTVKPALTAVAGVAEIATLGGFERQYQVVLDPARLEARGVGVPQVIEAIRGGNRDVGGRVLELGGTEYVVRGVGRVGGHVDLARTVIAADDRGIPVTVGDVAVIEEGPDQRRGIAEVNGRGEVVSGFVVMRYGENPRAVIERVRQQMGRLESALPDGVVFVEGYDRSRLIDRAIGTLRFKLIEESVIVALVTVLFLLHARSALVAVVTLPVGILMAFLAMRILGLGANIMSLGGIAIAIGAMIDAAIVMVENYHRHLERVQDAEEPIDHWALAATASREVGPALFVSLLIITLSFMPVFALGAQEGRLFHPLAWTKSLAMAAAALLSITLVPVLMGLLVRGRIPAERANPVSRMLIAGYRPLIRLVLRHRMATLLVSAAILGVTILPWRDLGREFMPPLDEGSVMDMPSMHPGVGADQAKVILRQRDAALAAIPEVRMVLGKVGRAETATDMAPMSMIETTVILRPRSDWRPGVDRDSILAEMQAQVHTPGVANMWSMPIRNRLDMLATGIKTPVGVKVFGPAPAVLDSLGRAIEATLATVPGAATVYAEPVVAGRYLTATVDRAAAARHGLSVDDIGMALQAAIGGMVAGEVINGRERYDILVRYPRALRDDPEDLVRVLVATPRGAPVALGEVAHLAVQQGATLLKSENAVAMTVVYIDLRDRDVGSFVAEARDRVDRAIELPAGYRLEWSGQFEAMERATSRLVLVVPLTLIIIFLLLYWQFGSMVESGIVMLSLPFSLVGGVWLLWFLDYNLSVAVAIGFIALAGIAAETGVVMLIYLDQAWRARGSQATDRGTVEAAVEHGAVERVRPKVMTVTAIMAGLVPILWSEGTGADVMKRIAAPMVGGMVSSTVLTLLVIPVIYALWREHEAG